MHAHTGHDATARSLAAPAPGLLASAGRHALFLLGGLAFAGGAVGLIAPDRCALNVAIRTIMLARDAAADAGTEADTGTLRYSAGCGIVAESVPRLEYEESLHKSAVLLRTANALARERATGASPIAAPAAPPTAAPVPAAAPAPAPSASPAPPPSSGARG